MKYSKDHTVYFNNTGNEIPSATTLLKILNKPALVGWANYLGFNRQRVEDVLYTASELGTTVHDLINKIVAEKYVIYIHMSESFSKLTVYKCLNSFFEWYKHNKIEPIFMEKSLYCDTFGGTVDFYGKVNDKLTIVDYKTSKKIRMTMFIQLALYCILLETNGYMVEQVGIVLVNEKDHDTKFITREELEPYIEVAKSLTILFHKYYNLNEIDKWDENVI